MNNDKVSTQGGSFSTVFLSVLLSMIASAAVFFVLASHFELAQAPEVTPVVAEENEQSDTTIIEAKSQEDRVVDLVERAMPAVVSVVITKDVPVIEQFFEEGPSTGDPFFDRFFGGFNVPQYRENGTEQQEVGGGTGFFVSADGTLVTNRHVVSDQDAQYTVLTDGGEKYRAEILAVDPLIDIAVLRVTGYEVEEGAEDQVENSQELPEFSFLEFADSDELKIGQTSIAIGNALAEFQNSVSLGVISGLSRSIVAGDGFGRPESLDNVIQTDTAINPGNSGGPLLNLDGKVIGVNVAVARGSENIGFSLPANTVSGIVDSVQEFGEIRRPFLGVRYMDVSESLIERNNLPVTQGALIQRGETNEDLAVMPGSPADIAGLRENDIILSIDGEDVTQERSLAMILRDKDVDQTVSVVIYRAGEEQAIDVTLTAADN